MCSSSKEQPIYKLSLFRGPEVTRLFTLLIFYSQTAPLLTKYVPWNPGFQQFSSHLINFLSLQPGWLTLDSFFFFWNDWAGQETQPLSTNQSPASAPGGLELKAKEGEGTALLLRGWQAGWGSVGSAVSSSWTAEGHSKNCCCWDSSGGCWWLPTVFSFSPPLSPQIASQEEPAAEHSSSQVQTPHRRVRSWGHDLQFLSSRFEGAYGCVGGRGRRLPRARGGRALSPTGGFQPHRQVLDLKLGARTHSLEM